MNEPSDYHPTTDLFLQQIADLQTRLAASEATISAVVQTIGGEVEGMPTSRVNFLQRLRELLEEEARLRAVEEELKEGDRVCLALESALRRVGEAAQLIHIIYHRGKGWDCRRANIPCELDVALADPVVRAVMAPTAPP